MQVIGRLAYIPAPECKPGFGLAGLPRFRGGHPHRMHPHPVPGFWNPDPQDEEGDPVEWLDAQTPKAPRRPTRR